jgi:hypothetical protein
MDSEFAKTVAAWYPFYSLAGSASACLVGLLFVAVSINLGRLTASESAHLLLLANHTFSSFLYVLLIALLVEIPGQSATNLGAELVVIGAAMTCRQIRFVIQLGGSQSDAARSSSGERGPFFKAVMPTLCYAAVMLAGCSMCTSGSPRALAALVSAIVLMLMTASRNSWRLLIELAQSPSELRSHHRTE